MEALGLTAEQSEVVATRGRDILVTAGAGSGKTHVLVARYLALLAECAVPEIAAVTFTDAAATEMRQRVRLEVMTRPELAAHRPNLDEAVIGTIHSLCRQLLREYAFEAGIDPTAPVLAEDEAEFELQAACLDALESAAADAQGEAVRALRALGIYGLTQVLPGLVSRRDEVRSAFAALPAGGPAVWEPHIRALLDASITAAVEAERPHLVETVGWLAGAATGVPDALSARVADALHDLGDVRIATPAELVARFERITVNRQGGARAAWRYDPAEVRARFGELAEIQRRMLAVPRWNEHDAASLHLVEGLRALFEDACARYAARKRALGALDYLDLELEAARLLETRPEVALRCRRTFRHIMVDEFQDTSALQLRVLHLLSGHALAQRGDGRPRPALFLVGDAKQAIYRFRGSDVRGFTHAQAEVEAQGGAVLRLTRSFRAHDPLVEALNDVFDRVLGAATHDFEAPAQRMTGRGGTPPLPPHLTLLPVSTRRPDGSHAPDSEARRVEADLVAAEVRALLDAGMQVWDRRAGAYRAATPRDVAVLLRRLQNVHLFERALESHGLPYRTPAGAGFFDRPEVLDLTNLLAWLAEPDDAIALVGALRSPLFLIDDPTLLALATAGRDWLRTLARPPDAVEGAIRTRCLRAAEVLGALRAEAAHAPVDALLQSALERTAYEAACAPLQGGDQALANIRKFVAMARTLAGRSLDEFVAYVVRRREDLAAREGQAVLDDSDAVRLLTVHGAKGLDFPIVVVPEAHLDAPEAWPVVRFRPGDGIAFSLTRDPAEEPGSRHRSGLYDLLHRRDVAEDEAEHRRLLYVAATRAADRLVISGAESGGWLAAVTEALDALPPERLSGIDRRPPLPVDIETVTRRPPPRRVTIPPETAEEEFDPPLSARPPIIPLRASTPVTALRPREEAATLRGHGDGLALVRGVLAHRALELWHTRGARPALVPLLASIDEGALDAGVRVHVAAEVDAMLDLFAASPLAATLRDPATRSWFEFPFAWDWDGVAVHGTLDLVYKRAGAWHIVDFKTDDLRGRRIHDVAAPYLSQLALYAGALERAVGVRPATALCFLRTSDLYTPGADELAATLVRTRAEIDRGLARAVDPDALADDSEG